MSVIISVVSSIDVISLSLNYNDLRSSDVSPLYDMIDPNCAWDFVRNLADMLKFYRTIDSLHLKALRTSGKLGTHSCHPPTTIRREFYFNRMFSLHVMLIYLSF